jgi:hypothetical protein
MVARLNWLRLSLSAALIALIGSITLAASPVAAAHLYASGNGSLLLRFPIINGVPARMPDLTIRNVGGGPIAVSPLGSAHSVLYANNAETILAFDYGHTKVDRTIFLPPPSPGLSWSVAGLAVDGSGYLYVGAFQQGSDAFGRKHPVRVPTAGVLVYGPTANGRAQPVAAISNAYVLAIAMDETGNLFLCGQYPSQAGFCDRFSHVRTHAKLLSSFTGPTLGYTLGATVIGSEIYLSSQDQTHRYDFTAQVFPTSANGSSVQPTREIVATSGSLEGQLAAYAGKLYAQDARFHGGIWEFDADANGNQPALAEVVKFVYGANGVAIGR